MNFFIIILLMQLSYKLNFHVLNRQMFMYFHLLFSIKIKRLNDVFGKFKNNTLQIAATNLLFRFRQLLCHLISQKSKSGIIMYVNDKQRTGALITLSILILKLNISIIQNKLYKLKIKYVTCLKLKCQYNIISSTDTYKIFQGTNPQTITYQYN